MSTNFNKMCGLIVEDYFGPVVEQVASTLLSDGTLTLAQLLKITKLPTNKVKECLNVLIQHNLVYYTRITEPKPLTFYSMKCDDVLPLLRYPMFLSMIEKIGPNENQIMEEITQGGQVAISKVLYVLGVKFLKEKDNNEGAHELIDKLNSYYDTFHSLARRKYVIRSFIAPNSYQNSSDITSKQLFHVPQIDIKQIVSKIEASNNPSASTTKSTKSKSKSGAKDMSDSKVLWKINSSQFYEDMKNEVFMEAVTDKFSSFFDVRQILQVLIKCGTMEDTFMDETSAISITRLSLELQKLPGTEEVVEDLKDCMEMLVSHSNGLVSEGEATDRGGGAFKFNMKLAAEVLLWSLVESIIIQKHGAYALRIFRLIKTHKYVSQEKITQFSMLPAKDAKQLTYKLLEDNFVILKEIRKSYNANAVNNKVEYCFYINLPQIAYELRETCYKAISNAKIRAAEERAKCSRLTGKEEKIQRILANMVNQGCNEEQLQEIQELITPPERAVLSRLEQVVDQLNTSVFHTDHTLFMIYIYFYYQDRESVKKMIKK